MIGYLKGEIIKELSNKGCSYAIYSTSTTPKWVGDLTSVYFFNSTNREIAHQTGLANNDCIFYERSWGNDFDGTRNGYQKNSILSVLIRDYKENPESICDSIIYRII